MKLYNAGIYTAGFSYHSTLWLRLTENEQWQRRYAGERNLLESFHYIGRQRSVDMIRRDGHQVFLDSGAFSMWSLGATVDIKAYCRYIQANEDIIRKEDGVLMASVMDAIGDAEGTLKNQQEMERLGVRPLPCFHFGEDPKYLEHYIANYSYLTLGGMVAQESWQLKLWLDEIWDKYLTDGAGRPKVRVHGFGLTSPELMRRYPWFSVDSSSWVQQAKVGMLLLLPEAKGIDVSNRSPRRKVAGQHLDTFPPPQRDALVRRFTAEGVDVPRAQETYLGRWCYNMYAYSKLGEIISTEKGDNPTFTRHQPGLF